MNLIKKFINLLLLLLQLEFIYSYPLLRRKHCDPLNKSTYIIPDANNCSIGYGLDGDGYFFGPCYDILTCLEVEEKCMFANGRDKYCLGIDSHFCSFCDSGKFINYFQVECG